MNFSLKNVMLCFLMCDMNDRTLCKTTSNTCSPTCKTCGNRKAIFPSGNVSECGKCYTSHIVCSLCFGRKGRLCLFCPQIPMSRCVNCNWTSLYHGVREFPFCKPLWCYNCFHWLQCVQCGDMCSEAFEFRKCGVQFRPNSLCVHCVDDLILQPLVHSLPLALIGIIQNYITE